MSAVQRDSHAPLAEAIQSGKQILGLIVKMPNPALVEQAAYLDFDLVVIDCEHGLGDGEQLEHHIRAADSVSIPTLVRIGDARGADALRALDAGADGLIVPHVSSIDDARFAIELAHYPPLGKRGLATSTRGGRYGSASLLDHLQRSLEQTVVVAQIEHRKAVPQAQAIASVPHMSAVWLGPGDLSLSLGHPGDLQHPAVVDAVDEIVHGVLAADSAALCVLVSTPDDVKRWSALGASMFLFASPELIARSLSDVVASARAHVAGTARADPDNEGETREQPHR